MGLTVKDKELSLISKDSRFQLIEELPLAFRDGRHYRVLNYEKKLNGWECFGRHLAFVLSALTVIPLLVCYSKIMLLHKEARDRKLIKAVQILVKTDELIVSFDKAMTDKPDLMKGSGTGLSEIIGKQLCDSGLHARLHELSQFLLVPEGKLGQKLCHGAPIFGQYVLKKMNRYGSILELAAKDYRELIASNEKTGGSYGRFTKREFKNRLMKLVRVANRALENERGKGYKNIAAGTKEGWNILAQRMKGRLSIFQWSGRPKMTKDDIDYLGSGSFGVVQRIFDFAAGKFSALKVAETSDKNDYGKACRQVFNEAQKLSLIHKDGIKEGLQLPPEALFDISEGAEGKQIAGFLQPEYNMGSLDQQLSDKSFQNLDKSTKRTLMRQLLSGLATLQNEENPIVHGDIKPKNVFLHRESNGTLKAFLGDLGDAKYLKSELRLANRKNHHLPSTVYTKSYMTDTDLERLRKAETEEEWIAAQLKRDIFALASTLWKLLSNKNPYEYNSNKYKTPITAKGLMNRKALERQYDKKLIDMLALALSEDPDLRPSIEELRNVC